MKCLFFTVLEVVLKRRRSRRSVSCRTLRLAASDARPMSDIVLAELRAFPWVVNTSDAQALACLTHMAFLRVSRSVRVGCCGAFDDHPSNAFVGEEPVLVPL